MLTSEGRADPEERATRSLRGVVLGDSFGERYFFPSATAVERIRTRQLEPRPWRYTDDGAQAAVLVRHLRSRGTVDCDALAVEFGEEYVRDSRRGYGMNAHDLLGAYAAGASWREEAGKSFNGTGSMGNGAAMRVAPLGAYFADDLQRVSHEAERSAVVTHTNPNGVAGAEAVAVAAAMFARGETDAEPVWRAVLDYTRPSMTRDYCEVASRIPRSATVEEVVRAVGSGSSVCAHDTVPFSIWSALREPRNYEEAMWFTVSGLGDRDTTCAIVGGILGASPDVELPRPWLRLWEGLP